MDISRNNEKRLTISAHMDWDFDNPEEFTEVYIDITNTNIFIRFSTIAVAQLRDFFEKEVKDSDSLADPLGHPLYADEHTVNQHI